DANRIGDKAVEKGVITQAQRDEMSEHQLVQLIFAPGFSTAAQVSDLSGRGVGMDVVRTNITKLNGTVDVTSVAGEGSCVTIKIPLTLAIMPAMMVRVGRSLCAVPLSNVIEIVKPGDAELNTISGKPMLRLRDSVLPLVDLKTRFAQDTTDAASQFAVVVASGEQRAGLLVDGLLGQEEVVIKPLDDLFEGANMVSGATVREDGGVSLILDVSDLILHGEQAA
ncbi:MAG: chemotaxis protein CheW, partial [Planctomycetota bacterium]